MRQRKTGSSPRSSGSSSRDHLQRRNHSKERERRRTVRIMMMLILILKFYLIVLSIWRKEEKAPRESLKWFILFNSQSEPHHHPLHRQKRSRPFRNGKQYLMFVSTSVLTKYSSSAIQTHSFTAAGCS